MIRSCHLLVPVGHFHLAARQADDRSGAAGTGNRHRQVLQEGVEALGQRAMAVDEVQNFVEEQQHGGLCGGEHPRQRLGPRRRGPRRAAERCDALIARQLTCQVDPGRLPSRCRIPGVADEHADPGCRSLRQAGLGQQVTHAGERRSARPAVGEVVKRREGVRLAAAELGDQGEDRRRVPGLTGQPPEHHAGMLRQRPREAGAREERRRIAVILGSGAGDDLLQGDRELVRAERAAFPHFLAQRHDPVPGLHQSLPCVGKLRMSSTEIRMSRMIGLPPNTSTRTDSFEQVVGSRHVSSVLRGARRSPARKSSTNALRELSLRPARYTSMAATSSAANSTPPSMTGCPPRAMAVVRMRL